MKNKILFALIVICGVCLSATSRPPAPQWEYKFQYQCDEKKANALASEGWELINMTASGSGTMTAVNCAFKRAK
jgi:predicted Rossmann-fold nucleotide-binding protein